MIIKQIGADIIIIEDDICEFHKLDESSQSNDVIFIPIITSFSELWEIGDNTGILDVFKQGAKNDLV